MRLPRFPRGFRTQIQPSAMRPKPLRRVFHDKLFKRVGVLLRQTLDVPLFVIGWLHPYRIGADELEFAQANAFRH